MKKIIRSRVKKGFNLSSNLFVLIGSNKGTTYSHNKIDLKMKEKILIDNREEQSFLQVSIYNLPILNQLNSKTSITVFINSDNCNQWKKLKKTNYLEYLIVKREIRKNIMNYFAEELCFKSEEIESITITTPASEQNLAKNHLTKEIYQSAWK